MNIKSANPYELLLERYRKLTKDNFEFVMRVGKLPMILEPNKPIEHDPFIKEKQYNNTLEPYRTSLQDNQPYYFDVLKHHLFKGEQKESKEMRQPTSWSPISAGINIGHGGILSKSFPYILWYIGTPANSLAIYREGRVVSDDLSKEPSTQFEDMFERLQMKPVNANMEGDVVDIIFMGEIKFINVFIPDDEIITPDYIEIEKPVGYIDFIVGNLNVMDYVKLVGEETGKSDENSGWIEGYLPELDALSSPKDHQPPDEVYLTVDRIGLNKQVAIGDKSGIFFTIQENVAVPVEDLKPQTKFEGIKPHTKLPMYVLRYYLDYKDTNFTVGEFLATAVKAKRGGFLGWGGQETNPFLHCGLWFDVYNYSSGIIIGKELVNYRVYKYKVAYHGFIYDNIYSTDFTEYQVNDRVAVIKFNFIIIAPLKYWNLNGNS